MLDRLNVAPCRLLTFTLAARCASPAIPHPVPTCLHLHGAQDVRLEWNRGAVTLVQELPQGKLFLLPSPLLKVKLNIHRVA